MSANCQVYQQTVCPIVRYISRLSAQLSGFLMFHSSSSCALLDSVGIHGSRPLVFWINSVDDIHPCHYLKPSTIISLGLPLLPLIFPVITTFSSCLSSHYITKERCLPPSYSCV
ncbi:hypothetical protein BsWGS_17406 [Bradybaena similaris]